MEKKQYGWTIWGILGFSFAPAALIFVPAAFIASAANPGEKGKAFLFTFLLIGAVFLLLSLIFLSVDLWRRHLQRRAYNGGNAVTAVVTSVKVVHNVNINGKHPSVVECAYQGNIYRSRYLYRDIPETGTEVTVYVDRSDERIGFVDI